MTPGPLPCKGIDMTTYQEPLAKDKFETYIQKRLEEPTTCPRCYQKPEARKGDYTYLCGTPTCLVISFAGPRIEAPPM